MAFNMKFIILASLLSSASISAKTISRDVVIIGGGSAGTYSAIRLQQMGLSVALIEKENRLGGE
jgi:heterodisulfide reductase subunit A-like polyferredoxin